MKNKNPENRFSFKDFLKARNTRRGVISIAITVLIVVAIILLNVAINGLTSRYSLYVDTTPNKAYRLQDVTADYAASINKDVDFYVLYEETTFEDYGDYYVQANKLIHQLCECSPHISLHYINLTNNPTFVANYPEMDWSTSHLCLVVSGKNYRVIDADDMFDYEYDSTSYSYVVTDQHIEQALATAILSVTSDQVTTIAVLTGQAEEDSSAFCKKLGSNAFNVITVDLSTGTIPDEAEFLFIYAPAVDIDEDMYEYLSGWLTNNGSYGHHLIYFPSDSRDVAEFPNLNALIADYGMSVDYGYVREDDRSNIPATLPTPLCARYNYADTDFTETLQNAEIPVFLFCTMPVNIDDSTLAKPLLTSSDTSFFGAISIEGDFEPEYQVFNGAAYGTKTNGSTENPRASHVVVVGSSRALMEELLNYKAFNNTAYFVNLFSTLSEAQNIGVIIEGKDLNSAVLGADSAAAVNIIMVVVRFIIPAAILIAGLVIWLRRRHR